MSSPPPDGTDAEPADPQLAELQAQHTVDVAAIAGLEADKLIDQAMIEQLQAEGVIQRATIANLEAALVSSRRIGAALGIIMATQKITEAQAFEVLRAAGQNRNRKLRDIADDVFLAGAL